MVKNVAKLVLFLSISFAGLLIISTLVTLLSDWTDSALLFPPNISVSASFSGKTAAHLGSSIPIAFYLSILFGLNYAARRRIKYPLTFIVILVFTLVLGWAAFLGVQSLEKTGFTVPLKNPKTEMAKPGFILNQGTVSGNKTIFLGNPYKSGGATVTMIEGQALAYQSQGATVSRTRLPFFIEKKGFFGSIYRDLASSYKEFSACFNISLFSYCVYAGSLAVFLLSLGCLVNISFWSLANLFFGALVFRGVLALESFLNQNNIRDVLASFAGKIVNPSLINPIIFIFLSIMILLYSGLVYLARGRVGDG